MRKDRKSGIIITGLPDSYGRGRIIGDYRHVALYGIDFLIEDKINYLKNRLTNIMLEEAIRLREEINEQIRALKEIKIMASNFMGLLFLVQRVVQKRLLNSYILVI